MGAPIKERRLAWAVEEDHGKRWLHVKANFPMPGPENQAAFLSGVCVVFEIDTTSDPAQAVSRSAAHKTGSD
jgi:hypothetical protein